ncbi:tetraacyldisaccharide 4'-kinase [Pigmentiphaga litoralis]|uniref:tetraacyldisaccharide 4'-kinase n=1 Tax=Pigmentiphaga litoralis TaxID=516702 RepID=UPI003B42B481
MKDLLQRQWQTGGWLSVLLTPLSWLTGAVVAGKRTAYRHGWKQPTRIDVPVIVIGNLYVGGTGKTPFLLATLEGLRARGWTPGVVSRGYGAQPFDKESPNVPRTGQGALDAALFGDEPALIAGEAGVPVAVHPRRALAAQALRRDFPAVDVIVADDGLQHLALARDVEVIVQDARGVGNGRLLPAGPLREPAARRDTVDVVVTNLTGTGDAADVPDPQDAAPDARHPRHLTMRLVARHLRRVNDGQIRPLSWLMADASLRIGAAAGIGHPDRFFTTLRQAGIHPVVTRALPDHFDYATSPFSDMAADVLLVTDKDAVKCGHLNDPRIWAVAVSAHLSDPTFFDWLDTRLHGHTPA